MGHPHDRRFRRSAVRLLTPVRSAPWLDPTMAELVQRYLDQLVAEYAPVGDGALADYIPELTTVDPTGFGLTI